MQEVSAWIDKSEDQYKRGRYSEALVSAEQAIAIDPDETNAWWFYALSQEALGNLDDALEALDTVTDLSPYFANGWARYGSVLQELSADEDDIYSLHMTAQEAFEKAIEIDASHLSALSALAQIYENNGSNDPEEIDKEIYVLTRLDSSQEWLTSNQLNRLGILHYDNKNFFDAIKYWQRNIDNNAGPASLYNLGLAYAHPEVSQEADAIDIWRLVNKRYPEYRPAYTQVEKTLPRLLNLTNKNLSTDKTILESSLWFKNYINPFELLNFQETLFAEDIDQKIIKRKRKRLLQEIDLEDGKIEWLSPLEIDRSKAIGICDELHNDEKFKFHLQVFNNKPLLRFLTKGEHLHFSVQQEWSPIETIDFMSENGEFFKSLLSKPFTKQFDLVFNKSISKSKISLIELLLDGRRWITDPNSDSLFDNARKQIDSKLIPLEQIKNDAENVKPSISMVKDLLHADALLPMLNVFPTFFWAQQDKAISIIRDIAITCYNHHGDSSLSKQVLELAKGFYFKSKKHNHLVEKDLKTLEKIITEEKQHEAFLTSGGQRWAILKDGVRKGDIFIPAESVTSVRWGIMISGYESNPTYDFLFVFKSDKGKSITFSWVTSKDIEKHQGYNSNFIKAIFHYIMPNIVENQLNKIIRGYQLNIGGCNISKNGVEFETQGWIFTKQHYIPWSRVDFDISNGSLIVFDKGEIKKQISLTLRDIDNAMIIQFLKEELT